MFKRFIILLLNFFLALNCLAEESAIQTGELKVVSEISLHDLLKSSGSYQKHEASGVVVANGKVHIAFDNHNETAQVDFNLKEAQLQTVRNPKLGYEGITYNPIDHEFYLVEEALKHDGEFKARLSIMSQDLTLKKKKWLQYNFQSKNKGFEGLTFVTTKNKQYILALCEGNACESGAASKIPGTGRIQVFLKKKNKLKYVTSISLPPNLPFIDYSGMAISDSHMLAITSQESSAVWVGKLDVKNWHIAGDSTIYKFPVDNNGNPVYCNIEGIDWLSKNQLVTVSDAKKDNQPEFCKSKAQSVHIISLSER